MTTQTVGRKTNWVAEIDGYILMGLGAMLLLKLRTGQLPLYVHTRYTPLIAVTAVLLVLIGLVRSVQNGTGEGLKGRAGLYGLLLAPILLGVIMPAKPAGSALIDPQQLNNVGAVQQPVSTMAVENTEKWNLLSWTFARYEATPEQLEGKPVDVVGFVYRTPDQPTNEFNVVRYTLACCVADRRGVSLRVKYDQAATLSTDQWVRVKGTIQVKADDKQPEFVVTQAQVEQVAQPRNPYLYANE